MELVSDNIKPRDIVNAEAIKNALAVDMALGGSTNTILHLPAIASEAKIDFSLKSINIISAKTPNLCRLSPAGEYHIFDLYQAGGIEALMNELLKNKLIDGKLLTVTGKTVQENVKNKDCLNKDVIRPVNNAYLADG